MTVTDTHPLKQARLETLAYWQQQGVNPYPYRFEKTASNAQLQQHYATLENGEVSADVVAVAGRIMAIRNSGMFIDLQDDSDKIQVFCHKDNLSAEQLEAIKHLDIGDIAGFTGLIRRTPRGELSVKASEMVLLSKSLLPLPEKFHGLSDIETRYRQRYVDLIVTPESRDTLRKRCLIIAQIREFLTRQGFLEVETPMLQTIPGGAAARPFATHHNTLDIPMYLRIAPELFLKRLIVGGLSEKVFELNRNFRNEGISPRHNPEFTMMELYQAYADYNDMMRLTENLIAHVAQQVLGTLQLSFLGHDINLATPWAEISMVEAVTQATGFDFMTLEDATTARAQAQALGVHTDAHANWGQVVEAVFEHFVEPTLIQPTHVKDYPLDISPLAKAHRDNPRLTERFETRIGGWEVANAFSELNDPLDQRRRFEAQVAQRGKGDSEAHPMDEDYLTALEYGMPPTGGLGIGIDRLVMLLTNASNIRDVIAFPTLKPRG